ncbi:NAD(P)-dependent oxidoreductase [Plantactinospora solaniradicis]|uniref:NAD(P)-dependent oxidoreductase n=1 Tax=Plantactinospora solaniradicis TaxID=1723736 RepID=A0ABW1KDV6_9ACTN
MWITVFGAAGQVGSRVVSEGLSRGHQVTAVVRDPARLGELHPDAEHRTGDAADVGEVVELSAGRDLVVSATRPGLGREQELVVTARAQLAAAAKTGVRLLIVGGAASLTVPGGDGRSVLDEPAFLPAEHRPIALACVAQFAAVCADTNADWTYLSPPALLEPGTRTGRYRLGADELLVDADGGSWISMEDLAVALLDEAEQPRHRRARFTVAH